MEEKTKEELEAEISKAMLARISDFKEEADKLTLEGVRRALEKDLGLKKLSLDAHKKFIKQCLDKFYYGAEDIPKTEEKVAEEPLLSEKEETSRECDDFQPAADLKNSSSDVNEITKGSPALVGEKNSDHESEKESLDPEDDTDISEDAIKKAIRKRAAYLRSNLQITLVKVRRLLEEDLKLGKNSLDAYKKLIGSEVDEILQSSETVEATNGDTTVSADTMSRLQMELFRPLETPHAMPGSEGPTGTTSSTMAPLDKGTPAGEGSSSHIPESTSTQDKASPSVKVVETLAEVVASPGAVAVNKFVVASFTKVFFTSLESLIHQIMEREDVPFSTVRNSSSFLIGGIRSQGDDAQATFLEHILDELEESIKVYKDLKREDIEPLVDAEYEAMAREAETNKANFEVFFTGFQERIFRAGCPDF